MWDTRIDELFALWKGAARCKTPRPTAGQGIKLYFAGATVHEINIFPGFLKYQLLVTREVPGPGFNPPIFSARKTDIEC